MIRLGVNIDHVATLRQARQGAEPDPVWAAVEAELGGADGITVHLREDRRHIQTRDVEILRRTVQGSLNLEMAAAPEVIRQAVRIVPDRATLVPERRQEVTTEGGLDAMGGGRKLREAIRRLQGAGIRANLFIDPVPDQIGRSADLGADGVELHTGAYALARQKKRAAALTDLAAGAVLAANSGLFVAAGHGLNYLNVGCVAALPQVEELNIGHSIVSRAIFVGLRAAVGEMREAMAAGRVAADRAV